MKRRNKEDILRKKHRITFRLTDQEFENVQTAANRLHVSPSDYIRRLISEKPIQLNYVIEANSEELTRLIHEYGKIGTNLNQIALYFNTGGNRSKIMEDEIHEAIIQLFELRNEVLKLGGDFGGSTKTYRK